MLVEILFNSKIYTPRYQLKLICNVRENNEFTDANVRAVFKIVAASLEARGAFNLNLILNAALYHRLRMYCEF